MPAAGEGSYGLGTVSYAYGDAGYVVVCSCGGYSWAEPFGGDAADDEWIEPPDCMGGDPVVEGTD